MNQLKRYLKGEIHYMDPCIVETLKKYKSIKIDSTVYDTKEMIKRIEPKMSQHASKNAPKGVSE